MKEAFYRCENEFGPDPCEWAKNNRLIPQSEIPSALDGGIPKCPGKTINGNPCNSELILIKKPTPQPRWPLYVAGAVALLIVGFISYPHIFPPGDPQIQASPNPLIFAPAKAGDVTANLTIRNNGNGELIIDKLETSLSVFSVPGENIRVSENSSAKLPVRFTAQTNQMTEGELVLHSNDKKSETVTIKLIANRDPWWVYNKLNETSRTMQKGQGQ